MAQKGTPHDDSTLSGDKKKKSKLQDTRDENITKRLLEGIAIAASRKPDLNIPEDIETSSDKTDIKEEDEPLSDSDLPTDHLKMYKKKSKKNKLQKKSDC